jgi:hypothetical protein
MSETSIIAIILSLFAVGGTLGGVWFGHLLERSNEKRKWRRERCLEVYTEVLNSCDVVVFEADKAYGIECGDWKHVEQNEVVLEKVSEMDRALHKALLLLSRDVYRKVFDLADHCGKQIGSKSMKCPKLSESEWHKIRIIDLAPLFADCQFAARNDLELFPKLYRVKGFKTLNEELSKGTPG